MKRLRQTQVGRSLGIVAGVIEESRFVVEKHSQNGGLVPGERLSEEEEERV